MQEGCYFMLSHSYFVSSVWLEYCFCVLQDLTAPVVLSSNSELVWVLQKSNVPVLLGCFPFQKAVFSRFQRGSGKLSYCQLLTGMCRLPFRTEESLRIATVFSSYPCRIARILQPCSRLLASASKMSAQPCL